MDNAEYQRQAATVLKALRQDLRIGDFIDAGLRPPMPHGPSKGARLFVLGQDPTVRRVASRKNVRAVLNLDQGGALRTYLDRICRHLRIDSANDVYAANLANNFFVEPPADRPDVLARASELWAPLLRDQLAAHPDAVVVTLGDPVLRAVVTAERTAPVRVRDYWGYAKRSGKAVSIQPFRFVEASDNSLGRRIFPLPHQPSLRKAFYDDNLDRYVRFVCQTENGRRRA
jgi:uracil-DNA glycosylase